MYNGTFPITQNVNWVSDCSGFNAFSVIYLEKENQYGFFLDARCPWNNYSQKAKKYNITIDNIINNKKDFVEELEEKEEKEEKEEYLEKNENEEK